MAKDFYKILGVAKKASKEEMKKRLYKEDVRRNIRILGFRK
jgi:DnaJ-class molecular chaperone